MLCIHAVAKPSVYCATAYEQMEMAYYIEEEKGLAGRWKLW